MSTAILFDRVSKKFTLHHQRPRSFQELAIQMFDGNRDGVAGQPVVGDDAGARRREEFWALQDVSFAVDQGESVGLIGPNGAGKSTALKLIARILPPTSGDIEVNGRVGALLELGAGFHPDLSGRENIYLNGSILGLRRGEIDRKLDQIISFAELERFIDMSIRHYSSGMRLRLGFSVAVHMEPDILLVDEVLAVGDAAFQHKCLERIRAMQRDGVAIVLVSHNLEEVINTCNRAIWVERGRVQSSGLPSRVVRDYLSRSASQEQARRTASLLAPSGERSSPGGDGGGTRRRWGDRRVEITQVRLLDGRGQASSRFRPDQPMRIEIDYQVQQANIEPPAFGVALYRMDGVRCYGTNTALDDVHLADEPFPSKGTVAIDVPVLQLLQGEYTLDVAVHDRSGDVVHDYVQGILCFTVRSARGDQGVFRPQATWSLSAR